MLSSAFSPRTKLLLGQMLRFGIVGVINTLLGLAAIYAFMWFFKCSVGTANALGYAVGLIVGFLLNARWTFKSKQSISRVFPKYSLCFAISYFLNLGVVLFMARIVNPYLSQIFGMVTYTLVFFFASRFFVFVDKSSHKSAPSER